MMKRILLVAGAFCALGLASCATAQVPMSEPKAYGTNRDGQTILLYTLHNSKGTEASIINYGGILQSLKVAGKDGTVADVVLGFADPAMYPTRNGSYFGAIVGRYANRIAGGQFAIDGTTYTLAKNAPPNNLHGGPKGFDKVVWNATPKQSKDGQSLELTYLSKDGDQGFPGNLQVTAVYTLTENNDLRLELSATTDKPTVCNLTSHTYWNLAGSGTVLDQEVQIFADKYSPVGPTSIPIGMEPVKDTPFDFTTPTAIGAHIADTNAQIKAANGYDHNFVLNKKPGELALAARVTDKTSGRVMEVLTSAPGLQFYSGNGLNGTRGKIQYQNHGGFAMEAEGFPDSPNHPDYPSTTLRPGETFHNTIIFRFKTL